MITASYPLLLFLPSLDSAWVQQYLFVEMCSLLGVFVTIWSPIPELELDYRCAAAAACGFATAAAALICYTLASGASMDAMFEWLLIRPRQMLGRQWYVPDVFAWWWYLVPAPLGAALALAVRFYHPRQHYIAALKFVFGGRCDAARSWRPNWGPVRSRSAVLYG